MLITTTTLIKKGAVPMNIVTSEAHFRQRVIRYSQKHGVTAASIRHHRSRQAIYEWKVKLNLMDTGRA